MTRQAKERNRAGAMNLTNATTDRSFKCQRCGNMFAALRDEADCDVCGFHCTSTNCQVVYASNEDY